MYEIYTDGSSKYNGMEMCFGGFAYIILKDGEVIYKHAEGRMNASNQQMELMAAIAGVKKLEELLGDGFWTCNVYSDSAYLINCKTQSWYRRWQINGWRTSKGEQVSNQGYWRELIPYFEDRRFSFIKVKGHANIELNEEVDTMAQNAAMVAKQCYKENNI